MAKIWEPVWNSKTARWQVDFRISGERIRRRLAIRDRESKGLARREAKRLHDEAWRRHFDPAPAGTPFWKAAEAYVEAGGEARFLPPLIRHFGPTVMCEEIDPVMIAELARSIYPGRARATIRRQVETPIDAVLAFAAGKRRRSSGDTARTRWLSVEEAEALLSAADDRTRPAIALLLGTGLRTGELFAAEAADYDGQALRVRAEREGAGKSRAAARRVRVPARAANLFGPVPEIGALVLTPKGRPYVLRRHGGGQMAAAFNKARDAAGLGRDVTPHVLRHTWATWHYAHNRDLLLLMIEGGWARMDMATRYTKLAPAGTGEALLRAGWDFRSQPGPLPPDKRAARTQRG